MRATETSEATDVSAASARETAPDGRAVDDALEYAAVALALVTAAIHLSWGIPRFVNYASVGVMPDPRPPLFVLSGHAILLGLTLVAAGAFEARRTYLPGIALMLAHLAGYAAWHTVYDHGIEAVSRHSEEVLHVGEVAHVVLDHLFSSPSALVSKVAEAAVVVLLVALLVRSRRRRAATGGSTGG